MNVGLIKYKKEYEEALVAIDEELWGAEKSTSSGGTLDILIELVVDYENMHYPIDPPLVAQ